MCSHTSSGDSWGKAAKSTRWVFLVEAGSAASPCPGDGSIVADGSMSLPLLEQVSQPGAQMSHLLFLCPAERSLKPWQEDAPNPSSCWDVGSLVAVRGPRATCGVARGHKTQMWGRVLTSRSPDLLLLQPSLAGLFGVGTEHLCLLCSKGDPKEMS